MGTISPQLSLNTDLGICKKRSHSPMHVHGGRLVRTTVFAMLRIELNNASAVCLAGTADGRGRPLPAVAVPCRLCDEKNMHTK